MSPRKRKSFFIKDTFQIMFIAGFILLLFLEVMTAGIFIYKLSNKAVEEAAFKSHLMLETGMEIINPIILEVNLYVIFFSIFTAILVAGLMFYRLHLLFRKIIDGLESLAFGDNKPLFIKPYGGNNTRQLISEFNQAAAYLHKQQLDIKSVLDSLSIEKELKHIEKLQNKLYILISEKEQKSL